MSKKPVKIFVSYSHKDEDYYRLLLEGIKSHTKHSKMFNWEVWTDRDILPGELWHEVIQTQVSECTCAVLMVSSNFLASDYIEKHEFYRFIHRQEAQGFSFFPILMSPCNIEQWEELHRRQFFRKKARDYGLTGLEDFTYADLIYFDAKGQPLPNPNRERFHQDLTKELEKALEKYFDKIENTTSTIISENKPAKLEQSPVSKKSASIQKINTNALKEITEQSFPLAISLFREKRKELNHQSTEKDLAENYQFANQLTRFVLDEVGQLNGKVSDSMSLKKMYVHVHFDEIVYGDQLDWSTLNTIIEKRQQKFRFPWYERSLVVSALTLGVLQKFDPVKVYHLIDFVRDKEPFVWKRALVGLVIVLLTNERAIDENLYEDLQILKEDKEVQEGLMKIEEVLLDESYKAGIDQYKTETKFDQKLEFFEKPQHWFLPFYPENPVLRQHLRDPKFKQPLTETSAWGIDVMKYAFCLNYTNFEETEKNSIIQNLERSKRQHLVGYKLIQQDYPDDIPEVAVRKNKEYNIYLKELFFFLANFPEKRFEHIKLEKKSLYKSNLSQILIQEIRYLYYQALYHYIADRHEEALPIFLKLLEIAPNDYNLLGRTGYCLTKLKNWNKALEYFFQALAVQPESAWALWHIADCYDELEERQKAIEYQLKVCELEPENSSNWARLGYYYRQINEYDTALRHHLKSEELEPNSAWNIWGIAECYDKLKEHQKAIEIQLRACELEPNDADYWVQLGYYYEQIKEYEIALEYRLKANEIKPDMPWNLWGIANCYDELKEHQKAIDYQLKACELNPEDASYWGRLGYYHEQMKDYETALKHRLKANEIKPDMPWNLWGIANCYDELKEHQKAIEYQLKACELNPEDASYWRRLGHYYEKIKDYESKLKYYLKALEIQPADHNTLTGIGWTYFLLGQLDSALQFFNKEIEVIPIEESTYHPFMNAGHIAYINKDIDKTKKLYLQSMQVSQKNNTMDDAWAGFEEDYEHLGKYGIVKEDYWNLLNELKVQLEHAS